MATPSLHASSISGDTIIAGYFQSGEDAHRAINALLDEGFLASQIGAAFHTSGATGGAGSESATGTESMRQAPGRSFNEEAVDVDTSAGGPSSGSDAVQPVGLASGSGSVILGAGKPGPIPGSSLEHTGLPHALQGELVHDSQAGPSTHYSPASTVPATPAPAVPVHESWTAKLKHLFSPKPATTETSPAPATSESQNFGSGVGDLNLTAPHSYPYSQTEFASSVGSFGIPGDYAGQISQRLSNGGAVVTVSDTGRAVEVERIFEQHHGSVRFSSDMFEDAAVPDYEPRVEVFGHLEHRYPMR